jgi:hypothetical protein
MRFDRGANVRFHFACASVRKTPFTRTASKMSRHFLAHFSKCPGQNYSFHDISYVYDENGVFAGSGVVTANVHLTSANSFEYSATIQFFDADGNLVFSGCGRATGTRFQ